VEQAIVRIDALAAGGDAVGRAPDGRVVFVPLAAPGDRVSVRICQERARFLRGRVEKLLEPGGARSDPLCPVFGRCGGCAWQHVRYEAQREAKSRILGDALARIGGFELGDPISVVASPSHYAYRGRTRVRVEAGRVGYRRRGSHALCPVSSCPVLVPQLDACLRRLAAQPPRRDGEWELAFGSGRARAVPLGGQGGERIFLEVGGERIGFSPGVFAQSNALLLETLVERVAASAGSGALVLELFAGAGFFTLRLARSFGRVVALEASAAAVRDLRANLRDADLEDVEVHERRVELSAALFRRLAPDVVVLDPPRAGLPTGAVAALADVGARRIVYLSCDPATLARDLAGFRERGYRLRRVEGFDLFPQTPHVEALAVLEAERDARRGLRPR
jgi:23S rRNA (uracil1939-C5)-methyltransferase